MHGGAVGLPDALVDLAVVFAAGGHTVDFQEFCGALPGGGNLARVDLVVRVEGGLEFLQGGVQFAKIAFGVFRTHALAVLAPQQAAVALCQRGHRIAHRTDQGCVFRILHVQRGAYVQHAGIHVAEHAILQAVAVQQRTKFGNEVGQILRRHCRVFHEGLRPRLALHVAQQTHCTLAHGIHALHGVGTLRQRVPQPAHRGVGLQVLHEARHPGIHFRRVIAAELHQIDAQRRFVFVLRKIFGHAVPDEIVHGQQQHLRIHRFDGQGLLRNQRPGIAQGIHEGGIAHIHQYRIFWNGQDVELCLHHEAQ